MDVDKLFMIFSCARRDLRGIAAHYIGKPYTDFVTGSLIYECEKVLRKYNQVLQESLKIEMYPVISYGVTDTSVSYKLCVRSCKTKYEEIEVKTNEIP